MTEITDVLVDMVETKLDKLGIELTIDDSDAIRDVIDEVLEKYEET